MVGRLGVMVATSVLVAGLLAGCGAGGAAEAAVLEPAADAGADPFTDSVEIGPVASLPGNVEAVSASVRDELKTDPDTGVLLAGGSVPGLYGGTGDAQACDPDQLVAFLEDNPTKAKAWAGVIGIEPDDIASFVAGLTPVVLTSDTIVTNHGFRDGKATSKQSVLQAGTAVMVDDTGMPRVKCNCGNPLGPPAGEPLGDREVEGTPWKAYAPEEVVSVQPAETGGTITITDTETGDPVEVPVGSTPVNEVQWTAVEPAAESDDTSTVVTSADGKAWKAGGTIPSPNVTGLAWGDGTWIAVTADGDGAGSVLSSADLKTWKQVATADVGLTAVAHGDGRWIAVGAGSTGATWTALTSTDGVAWTPSSVPWPWGVEPDVTMTAIAFDGAQWTAQGILTWVFENDVPGAVPEDSYEVDEWTSADGTSWSEPFGMGTGGVRAALAASGGHTVTAAEPLVVEGEGLGGPAWVEEPIILDLDASGSPDQVDGTPFEEVPVDELAAGDGWMAVTSGPPREPGAAEPASATFYTSSDATTWTEAGSVPAHVSALAYGGGAVDDPPKETTTTTAPPDSTGSEVTEAQINAIDWANQSYDVPDCIAQNPVQMVNGSASSSDGFGGATLESVGSGDATDAPGVEAAAVIGCNRGGSASATFVTVFTLVDGAPQQIGTAFPGADPTASAGQVVAKLPVFGPNDPLCCPSSTSDHTWTWNGNEWTEG